MCNCVDRQLPLGLKVKLNFNFNYQVFGTNWHESSQNKLSEQKLKTVEVDCYTYITIGGTRKCIFLVFFTLLDNNCER